MGLQDLLSGVDAIFQQVSGTLNGVVIVLVIVLFGFIIGKIVDRILRRLFADVRLDERVSRWRGVKRNYARASRHTIVRLIYISTVLLALQWLSLLLLALYALLIVVAFALFVSLALWLRDVVPNLSGWMALRERSFGVGDDITLVGKTGVISGTVLKISALETQVSRPNGDVFFIPNATMATERVVKRRPVSHPAS